MSYADVVPFIDGIPTFAQTRLRLHYTSPHRGTVHIGINEVVLPFIPQA